MHDWGGRKGAAQWVSSAYSVRVMRPVRRTAATAADGAAEAQLSHMRTSLCPLQHLGQLGYLLVGVAAAAPCVMLPLVLPQPLQEARRPLMQVRRPPPRPSAPSSTHLRSFRNVHS